MTGDDDATAAREVTASLGLRAEPVRRPEGTTNAVFACGDAFVVVLPRGSDPQRAAARTRLAAVLAAAAPVVRPWPAAPEPVAAAGRLVTVWERVPVVPGPPDWRAVGHAVRALHEVPVERARAAAGRLRDADDLADVRAGVDHLLVTERLLPGQAGMLYAVADRLAEELATGRSDGAVVLHGDLHAPNLLPTADGVVLCDLDEVGAGSRDHDLGFLTDPARPTLPPDPAARAAFESGYGAPLPPAGRARTVARVAHLRRTVRVLAEPVPATATRRARAVWLRRLRLRSWADVLEDWPLDAHPVVAQGRLAQAGRVLRPGGWR